MTQIYMNDKDIRELRDTIRDLIKTNDMILSGQLAIVNNEEDGKDYEPDAKELKNNSHKLQKLLNKLNKKI